MIITEARMGITAPEDIELVTQVLEAHPVPDYVQRQTAVVEELGMELDSTRRQLDTISQHLEVLTQRMNREEDLLLLLCQRSRREKEQEHRVRPRRSAAGRVRVVTNRAHRS